MSAQVGVGSKPNSIQHEEIELHNQGIATPVNQILAKVCKLMMLTWFPVDSDGQNYMGYFESNPGEIADKNHADVAVCVRQCELMKQYLTSNVGKVDVFGPKGALLAFSAGLEMTDNKTLHVHLTVLFDGQGCPANAFTPMIQELFKCKGYNVRNTMKFNLQCFDNYFRYAAKQAIGNQAQMTPGLSELWSINYQDRPVVE